MSHEKVQYFKFVIPIFKNIFIQIQLESPYSEEQHDELFLWEVSILFVFITQNLHTEDTLSPKVLCEHDEPSNGRKNFKLGQSGNCGFS